MNYGIAIPGGFFDEERHLYRDARGTVVPSTTQVFSLLGLTDFSGVPEATLEWKRNFGIALHKAVELVAVNDLDWDSVDEQIKPALTGVDEYLKQIEYVQETTEQRMVHTHCGMSYGLTTDGTGTMMFQGKRRHVILDLKTGSKFSPTWAWQLGGYSLPQAKVDGGWLGLILQVDVEGKTTGHYVDVVKAAREFQVLLSAAILKINAGLAKIGG